MIHFVLCKIYLPILAWSFVPDPSNAEGVFLAYTLTFHLKLHFRNQDEFMHCEHGEDKKKKDYCQDYVHSNVPWEINASKREHWPSTFRRSLRKIWSHCILVNPIFMSICIRNSCVMPWGCNAHWRRLSSFLTIHASSYRASTLRPRGGGRTIRRELGCSEGRCRSTVPRMGFWAGHSVARIQWRLVASRAGSPYRGTLVHLQVSW